MFLNREVEEIVDFLAIKEIMVVEEAVAIAKMVWLSTFYGSSSDITGAGYLCHILLK